MRTEKPAQVNILRGMALVSHTSTVRKMGTFIYNVSRIYNSVKLTLWLKQLKYAWSNTTFYVNIIIGRSYCLLGMLARKFIKMQNFYADKALTSVHSH